jgi:6-pyruvoyl-tetrahydropterin synthase
VQIAHDGYVIDFGDIKKITRKLCKELNEHFLCPQRSDVIDVQVADGQVTLQCQDGAKFSFPEVRTCATVRIFKCCSVSLDFVSSYCSIHDSAVEKADLLRLRTLRRPTHLRIEGFVLPT